jgi:hypothetical protein
MKKKVQVIGELLVFFTLSEAPTHDSPHWHQYCINTVSRTSILAWEVFPGVTDPKVQGSRVMILILIYMLRHKIIRS